MTTRFVNLHFCAFKFIQLLPDGSLNNTNAQLNFFHEMKHVWICFVSLIGFNLVCGC